MQKNMTELKCIVNNREILLICEAECTTLEVKEALCQFMKHVGNVEDSYSAKLKEQEDSKIEVLEDSNIEEIG